MIGSIRGWSPAYDRLSIEDVLRLLEEASGSWTPLSPLTVEGPPATDPPRWSFSDSSTEENISGGEVSSLTHSLLFQSSRMPPPKGDADKNNIDPILDHQDLGAGVKNPEGSDSEESLSIQDRVGGTGLLSGF